MWHDNTTVRLLFVYFIPQLWQLTFYLSKHLYRGSPMHTPLTIIIIALYIVDSLLSSVRIFSKKAWRHFPRNRDILGLGLPSDNNFQPITSFVSLALLWQRDSGRSNLARIRPETRTWLVVFENVFLRCRCMHFSVDNFTVYAFIASVDVTKVRILREKRLWSSSKSSLPGIAEPPGATIASRTTGFPVSLDVISDGIVGFLCCR